MSAPVTPRPLRRALLLAALGVAAAGVAACGRGDARPAAAADATGKELAARHCQSCHLLPDPALLDRATWERWVLPRMARRLGLPNVGWPADREPAESGEGGRRVREAHVFPDSARLTVAEWDRLAAYYARSAPESLPRPAVARAAVGLPGFRARVAELRLAPPFVTLVRVDPARRGVWVGDAAPDGSRLWLLDGRGRASGSSPVPSPVPSPVADLAVAGDTLRLLLMGQLNPSDAAHGTVGLVPAWRAGAEPAFAWRIDGLQRPVHATYADLGGDGVEDVVVSEFGYLTGRLTWHERRPGGETRRHVLAAEPGALTTVVRDFDGDGRPDVLALTAQGEEGVSLFRATPEGTFDRVRLLRFPPSYGSTSMELVDVNGDGHDDIVYTNGDNGDYPGPPKPYHGVRIFLSDGRGGFAERYFFAMPGAFKAIARDFDGDGDVDVAAIAFYADYASGAPLPFVYLENVGGPPAGALRFVPRTFAGAERGRWLVMDAGDVDGDGDVDLVLGSFARVFAAGGEVEGAAPWQQPGAPAVVILENTRGRIP